MKFAVPGTVYMRIVYTVMHEETEIGSNNKH